MSKWEIKKLGEVCSIRSKRRNEIVLNPEDMVSFLPMEDMGIFQKRIIPQQKRELSQVSGSYSCFYPGDVLLAKVTPCFENGKLGIVQSAVNGVGFGSSELIPFVPGKQLTPDFLFYILASDEFRRLGKLRMQGTSGLKRVSKEFILSYQVPIPPLAEQKRIVRIIDKAFEKIDAIRRNAEESLQEAKDLFQEAIDDELSPKPGWKNTAFSKVATVIVGYAFKSKEYSTDKNDIPLLCGDNIMPGWLRKESIKYWPKSKLDNYRSFLLNANDVVLAMDRPWIKSGLKHAILGNHDIPALLLQRTLCLRTTEAAIAKFIYYILGSKAFANYILRSQTGSGVPHISGKQVSSFTFSMPDLNQIISIINRLDSFSTLCTQLEQNCQQIAADCEEMKKAILAKAFRGEL